MVVSSIAFVGLLVSKNPSVELNEKFDGESPIFFGARIELEALEVKLLLLWETAIFGFFLELALVLIRNFLP